MTTSKMRGSQRFYPKGVLENFTTEFFKINQVSNWVWSIHCVVAVFPHIYLHFHTMTLSTICIFEFQISFRQTCQNSPILEFVKHYSRTPKFGKKSLENCDLKKSLAVFTRVSNLSYCVCVTNWPSNPPSSPYHLWPGFYPGPPNYPRRLWADPRFPIYTIPSCWSPKTKEGDSPPRLVHFPIHQTISSFHQIVTQFRTTYDNAFNTENSILEIISIINTRCVS